MKQSIRKFAAILGVVVLAACASVDTPTPEWDGSPAVVVLGTGTPNADPDRSGPALAVVVGDQSYIVDAGAGVVRRAAAAASLHDIDQLRPTGLQRAFLTHLHSDHTVGLPDLAFMPWVEDRVEPLELIGPPGTVYMAERLLEAYAADIENRIEGLQPHTPDGWKIEARDVFEDGIVYEDSLVRVTAFRVNHANWEYSFGYRFDTEAGSVVISGDARPSESIAQYCNGCNLLVHEVYSAVRLRARPPEWQAYHSDAHTSTTELASIANASNPGRLVMYHQLYWGATDNDLLSEISDMISMPVTSARDLDLYYIAP